MMIRDQRLMDPLLHHCMQHFLILCEILNKKFLNMLLTNIITVPSILRFCHCLAFELDSEDWLILFSSHRFSLSSSTVQSRKISVSPLYNICFGRLLPI